MFNELLKLFQKKKKKTPINGCSGLNFYSSLDKKDALKSISKHLICELTVEKFCVSVQICLLIRGSENREPMLRCLEGFLQCTGRPTTGNTRTEVAKFKYAVIPFQII